MRLVSRRERPPAVLLDHLQQLADGERLLSWADTDDDTVVAATPSGLWWPGPDPADAPRPIAWQRIDKVTWRDGRLSVIEADVVDDELLVDRAPVVMLLTRPRDLPPTVRKRVEANIVRTELLEFGGGAVRFVGRRRPGRDGLTWWAHLETGTRDSESLRSAISARLAILRSS